MVYRIVCIPSPEHMLDRSIVHIADADDKFALIQKLCNYFNSDNRYLAFVVDELNHLHFLVHGQGWDYVSIPFLVSHYGFVDLPF